MSFKLLHGPHRHLVFTIDEKLRPFFLEDRSGLESFPEISVIEIVHITPESIIGKSTFGKEAVDMRVPFKGAAK